MSQGGRPLRFLTIVLAGWTGARVAILWPDVDSPRDLIRLVVPAGAAKNRHAVSAPAPFVPASASLDRPAARRHILAAGTGPRGDGRTAFAPAAAPATPAITNDLRASPAPPLTFGAPPPSGSNLPAVTPGRSRWSGSAWLLARDGGGAVVRGGPLLGGGQAGVRIAYSLARRVDAVGRVSTPLEGRGREVALGVEWQPTRLPIRLVVEQRFALDRNSGGDAPVIGVIGGFGPSPVAAGFLLETYAQAGAIRRNGVSGFIDAQARATRPVAATGRFRFDLGVGGWGSAQRGATRLDVGPTAGVTLPVGKQSLRLALDWRERIAGDARPGSGPALTIGTDF